MSNDRLMATNYRYEIKNSNINSRRVLEEQKIKVNNYGVKIYC